MNLKLIKAYQRYEANEGDVVDVAYGKWVDARLLKHNDSIEYMQLTDIIRQYRDCIGKHKLESSILDEIHRILLIDGANIKLVTK